MTDFAKLTPGTRFRPSGVGFEDVEKAQQTVYVVLNHTAANRGLAFPAPKYINAIPEKKFNGDLAMEGDSIFCVHDEIGEIL